MAQEHENLAASLVRQLAAATMDVDKLARTDEGESVLDDIASRPESPPDEVKGLVDEYVEALRTGAFGDKRRQLQARAAAAQFYKGQLDLEALGDQIEAGNKEGLLNLIYGLTVGGRRRGGMGGGELEQHLLAEQAMAEATGQEFRPEMDPLRMRATSDMYKAEREQARPLIEDNPRGYFANKLVAIWNSEGTAYGEMIELRAWLDSPTLVRDVDRGMMRLVPEMGAAIKAQKGPDLEHLPSNVPEQNNWLLFAMSEFCLPLVVEHDGKRELKRLDLLASMDIMEEHPELRALFFSNNKEMVGRGEELWAELITRDLLGIDPVDYKANPDKYKFYTVHAGGKDSMWDVGQADVTDEKLIPWNPFFDVPTQVVQADGTTTVVYEKDYARAGGVRNWRELFGGLKFAEVLPAMFMKAYGRVGQYDPAILGEWHYAVRPALRPKTYRDLTYSQHAGEIRPWAGHWYGDFWSENAYACDPMLLATRDREVMESGLATKSVPDLQKMLGDSARGVNDRSELVRRVVDLRARVIDFVWMDKAVRPWFENYLDAIAKGEKVYVPKELLLIGFPGRNVRRKVKDSVAAVFKDDKAIEAALAVRMGETAVESLDVYVDFGNVDEALQFMLFNRTDRGWLRTKDQMKEVVSGLASKSGLVRRVFDGWNPEKVLQRMGISSGRVGVDGLVDVVNARTMRSMRLDLLPDYVLWRWHYYLSNARKAADIQWQHLTAQNIAGAPLIQNMETIDVTAAAKQMAEAGEIFSGSMGQWTMLTGSQRAGLVIEKFYGLALNTIPVGSGRRRRHFVEIRDPQVGLDGSAMGDDAFSDKSDMYVHKPLEVSYRRPELGIMSYSIQVDEARSKEILTGPGGSVVFAAEDRIGNDKTSHLSTMYGGRPISHVLLAAVVNAGIDAGGVTGSTMQELLGNFLMAMAGRLPRNVLTDLENQVRMYQYMGMKR